MIKPIVLYPDARLRTISDPVAEEEFGTEPLAQLMRDLFDTLHSTQNGVGLSAIQIGVPKRAAVVRLWGDGSLFICNPAFTPVGDGMEEVTEGCLSFPDVRAQVRRYSEITLSYRDRRGDTLDSYFKSADARVVQHEIDHLNGRMFFDGFMELTREILLEKYTAKQAKEKRLYADGKKAVRKASW